MRGLLLSNTGSSTLRCLAIAGIAIVTGCTASVAEGTSPPATSAPSEPIPDKLASADDQVDITNAVLTATDPSCADHVGSYVSSAGEPQTQSVSGLLTISVVDEICAFESNQIPNHDPGQAIGPDQEISEQSFKIEIPARPTLAPSVTTLGLEANAILLNGVTWALFFDACFDAGDEPTGTETANCGVDPQNPWRYNTASESNDFGFDQWNAQMRADEPYHYHGTPIALYDGDCTTEAISPVVGFAPDGFPIFGPCFEDSEGVIRPATSSFQVRDGKRQDIDGYTTPRQLGNVVSDDYDGQFNGDYAFVESSGDLDKCNGMQIGDTYGYYITDGYPFVLACYSGTPLP